MNENLRAQLEKLWCQDIQVEEPITKPIDFDFNASNAINPTQDRLKCDEGLKCD